MRKIILLLSILICSLIQAQKITVKGTVTDVLTGTPIPGVTILIANTLKGTQSDFDGKYTINADQGAVLEFSSIGYITEKATVQGDVIDITLTEDSQQLDEVVVIGYGKKAKKDVTGAVALVSAETIEALKPIDASLALQGTTSGVAINRPSSAPGSGFNINIRGISSNGNNQPLIVIDGLTNADLNTLNPNDIESISVLKDAQAAIYGIQGANGVILVTTKSGRKNAKLKITYDGYTGIQETTKKLNYLNATEYALLLNESYAAGGDALPFSDIEGLGIGTDWQDEIFSTAFMTNHNVGISGGSEKINYYLGASNLKQDGIISPEKSNFVRNNVRFTLGVDLSDKFRLTTTTNYTTFDTKTLSDNGLGSVLFNALNYSPTFSVDQEDEDGFLGNEVINPLSQIRDTYNERLGNNIEGIITLDYKPTKNIKVTTRLGYKSFNNKSKDFSPIVSYGSGKVFNNDRSTVVQSRETANNYNWETFIHYDKLFNDAHHLEVTLGTSAQKSWGDGLFGTGFDVPNNSFDFADISLTTGTSDGISSDSYVFDNRLLSYFTRLQYDYKGKYLLSGMIRRDGASDFSKSNRVDYFPSATGGWKVSEEAFMNNVTFIDFLKIRGSYGVLGNNTGGNLFRADLDGEATYVLDGVIANGVAIGNLPNVDAKWETAEKLDVGFDLNLFKNKLEIVGDYFVEDRNDLLIANIPVSGILGAEAPGSSSPTVNAGSTRVKGFEFSMNYKDQIGEDFSYNIGYNFTSISGEVTAINGDVIIEGGGFGVGQLAPSRMEVGQPIGYFYGLQTDGVFQTTEEVNNAPSQTGLLGIDAVAGDIKYVDTNEDGIIDFNDRTFIGNPQPEFTMGLNLGFNYKNWDFTTYMYSELNKDMVRNYERDQPNVNRLALYLDRWTGAGTSNEVPRVTTGATNNKLFSSFYVEDASFLRIQNVQLGYSLSEDVLEKIGFSKVRLYTTVNNLYTFTNYTGFDPSASGGDGSNPVGLGIDNGVYPVSRQYLLGVNLAF